MHSFKTKKGSELEIVKIKGKDYLQVAQRLIWLNEEAANFTIDTTFLSVSDDAAICKATVVVRGETNMPLKSATATKRETKSDFPDFLEKAETSAVGRALAMLGFGTQFAVQDMDEGVRLADSPVTSKSTTYQEPPATKVATLDTSKFKRIPSQTATPTVAKPQDSVDI